MTIKMTDEIAETLDSHMKALRELKEQQTAIDTTMAILRANVQEIVETYGPVSTEYGNAVISKPSKTTSYDKKSVEQVEKMLEVLAQTVDPAKPILETLVNAKSTVERAGSLRLTFKDDSDAS